MTVSVSKNERNKEFLLSAVNFDFQKVIKETIDKKLLAFSLLSRL